MYIVYSEKSLLYKNIIDLIFYIILIITLVKNYGNDEKNSIISTTTMLF